MHEGYALSAIILLIVGLVIYGIECDIKDEKICITFRYLRNFLFIMAAVCSVSTFILTLYKDVLFYAK